MSTTITSMKRNYEALLVLNTTGKEDQVDSLVSSISKEIEDEGAALVQIDHIGRRKFPYNAQKLEAGYYVNIQFEGDPEIIEKLKVKLELNKDVHLQHYQKV